MFEGRPHFAAHFDQHVALVRILDVVHEGCPMGSTDLADLSDAAGRVFARCLHQQQTGRVDIEIHWVHRLDLTK